MRRRAEFGENYTTNTATNIRSQFFQSKKLARVVHGDQDLSSHQANAGTKNHRGKVGVQVQTRLQIS